MFFLYLLWNIFYDFYSARINSLSGAMTSSITTLNMLTLSITKDGALSMALYWLLLCWVSFYLVLLCLVSFCWMLSFVMFSVVVLSVAVRPNRLNVVLLSVVAPSQPTFFRKDFKTVFHFLAYKFYFPFFWCRFTQLS